LDYGEKRIGVAICDELGMTAQGLPTIIRKNRKHDWGILESLISAADRRGTSPLYAPLNWAAKRLSLNRMPSAAPA